jgi:hypothetical protein
MVKIKAKKWRAVQIDSATKENLRTLKKRFGETEAFHLRRAVEGYLVDMAHVEPRNKGVMAARKYLIKKSESASGKDAGL